MSFEPEVVAAAWITMSNFLDEKRSLLAIQVPESVKILDNIESNISNLSKIIGAEECIVNNVWRSTPQATQNKITYNKFREWLMTCPISYVQEEPHDFDDDSIVFETSKIKNRG